MEKIKYSFESRSEYWWYRMSKAIYFFAYLLVAAFTLMYMVEFLDGGVVLFGFIVTTVLIAIIEVIKIAFHYVIFNRKPF